MAVNDKNKKTGIANLNAITKLSNSRTYGIRSDIPSLLANDVETFSDKLNSDKEKNKSLINSHVSRSKLNSKNKKNISLYNFVDNPDILSIMDETLGAENIKFAQTLKDYEIIKRCIPQIHRVINVLKNNILSPDSLASTNIVGVKIPSGTDKHDEQIINNIIEKYKINTRLQSDIVNDYLIASVKYVTVVPYSVIPDMLYNDPNNPKSMTECINDLDNMLSSNIKTLAEAAGVIDNNKLQTLTESADYEELDSELTSFQLSPSQLLTALNEQLNDIEFIDGGMSYYKNAILNEASEIASSESRKNKSMIKVLDSLKSQSGIIQSNVTSEVNDGFIDLKTYKDIKKNVNFTGAHIEYLPAGRTIAFKMRDTIVGYFYVEDKLTTRNQQNVTTIMDKINSSVFMKADKEEKAKEIRNTLIKNIGDKLVKAINPKFINDNIEDLDIIYEFVRANELYNKPKRVVFFHPDDVCEFRRSDGSIMKNCMFFAKLYILTLLSNIIAKVTRGSDRNIHYVRTGLTTDIEGTVVDTIRAIKQNQIRYSDIGTINEIFNIVGSNVDVFMPVSVDGEKPIETETISGQNVDMNDDFLNSIIRSIIQSFGVPASVIDDLDSVDFAKTISMGNIDMAKASFDAQLEINDPLTKLIRLLIKYELPDYDNVDSVLATLNPPSIIVYEMNKDRMDSIEQVADKLADLMIPADGETDEQRRKRLFKLEYYKQNMPTWNWTEILRITDEVNKLSKETKMSEELAGNYNNQNNDYDYR